MTLTTSQKHAIDCVLSIFETGRTPTAASYATCTILADGAGISFGKHQCTDRAGSLDLVVKRYIALGGQHATALKAFEPVLAANQSTKEPPKGPWSKPVTDLVALLDGLGGPLTPWFSPTLVFTLVLLLLTIVNRARRALAESPLHR